MIKKAIKQFCYRTILYGNGKSVILNGFLDSGNRLDIDNKGMAVGYYFDVIDILKEKSIEKLHCISIDTATKKGKLYVGEIEKLEIYDDNFAHMYNNVLLAISLKKLDDNFDIILSPMMFLE